MTIKSIQKFIKNNFPLILVIFISLFIGLQNTSIRAYYSGWDNIHAEFNMSQYANRVFFGAWQEHEGLGAPTAKGHLSEITRLPVLYLLNLIVPSYLVRSSFIFMMYTIGGIGMYLYLKKIWVKESIRKYSNWLAGLGSLLYLLHPLTLQQFYISFEIFTVQFAFFPFLLLSIHLLLKKITWKSILIFMLIQLAIAPSAHTPTVHYLGILFSLIYALFSALDTKKFVGSLKFSFFVGLLTFVMNSYWILPNIYYGLHNSKYVSESEANVLFGPESLWSIRESNNLHSFLTGFHYLVTWRDYNFKSQEHELIFNEWTNHFSNPFRNMQMYTLGIIAVLGFFTLIFNKKEGGKRWAIIIIYAICVSLIWIELFPTKNLILSLYKSKTFLETFRNPFTKLSILYSFFLVVLFVEFIKLIAKKIDEKLEKKTKKNVLQTFLSMLAIYIVSITSPIFSGNFISEKLKVIYPPEYEKLYEFMKTKDHNARVLEMPYISREGWVLYDWSTASRTNAYQGIGFYFFGIPQPFLTPDFARWSEVNDFFYQELQYAIDKNDNEQFKQITNKYRVPLAIVDESRIYPHKDYGFEASHELLVLAGFKKIWQEDFISVYENTNNNAEGGFIVPTKLDFVASNLDRIKKDVAFSKIGEYISGSEKNKLDQYVFPFAKLLSKEISNVIFEENRILVKEFFLKDNYLLEIPKLNQNTFSTTVALQLKNEIIYASFPQHNLTANNKIISLSYLENVEIPVEKNTSEYTILVNGNIANLKDGEIEFLSLTLSENENDSVNFSTVNDNLLLAQDINWDEIKKEIKFELNDLDSLLLETSFPMVKANLSGIPSENCTKPLLGEISTTYNLETADYKAKNYGVNCNTLDLNFITPSSSYIMNVEGENFAGRSIKMFINYSTKNTIQEEHLLSESIFNASIPLDNITSDPISRYYVNWETRSFGKESRNAINRIEVMPFPLEKFSQISLTKIGSSESSKNEIKIISAKSDADFYNLIKIECANTCYFGINQAHDDLWIAYDKNNRKILPHFTYNNWANLWQVNNKSDEIIILYVPQLVAFVGMITIVVALVIVPLVGFKKDNLKIKKSGADKKTKINKHANIKSRTKKVFNGK